MLGVLHDVDVKICMKSQHKNKSRDCSCSRLVVFLYKRTHNKRFANMDKNSSQKITLGTNYKTNLSTTQRKLT